MLSKELMNLLKNKKLAEFADPSIFVVFCVYSQNDYFFHFFFFKTQTALEYFLEVIEQLSNRKMLYLFGKSKLLNYKWNTTPWVNIENCRKV